MIKRVMPYYKEDWVNELDEFLKNWDYWKEGAIKKLEDRVAMEIGRKHAIATNSTTNSIFMALYVWSLKYPHHDDVLIPNWGYPAAYNACQVLGLNAIPVEIDKWTLGMTSKSAVDNMSTKTLACVYIENNGVVGGVDSIKEYLYDDILFIEDSAPSMLQETAGRNGDVSMFSFSPTKPLCAGEGSVILTDNDELAEALRKFRHDDTYNDPSPSLNFAMSAITATYLLPQFDIIDEIIEMREWVHAEYKKHLQIFGEPYISTNRHGAIMYLSEHAKNISKKLTQFGIEHRYKYYPVIADESYIDFPISCEVRDQIIDLPMHQKLSSGHIKYICDIVKRGEEI